MENWNEPRTDEAQKPTRFIAIPEPLQKHDAVTRIAIPPQVVWVIESLSQAGFLGFLVGGCVRDACLGKAPADWDLTTNATPEQVIRRFCDGESGRAGESLGTLGRAASCAAQRPRARAQNPSSPAAGVLGASPWGRLRVIPTGLQHGTVTLAFEGGAAAPLAAQGEPLPTALASQKEPRPAPHVSRGEPRPAPHASREEPRPAPHAAQGEPPFLVEVTTFRTEGAYSDHRHPDQVTFSHSLEADLARRDFTVNAMAWNLAGDCLVDPYGGVQDLLHRRIRCVGEPAKRFREDGLRILRALRFASALAFSLEERTAAALFAEKEILRTIAPERIRVELEKLLLGAGVEVVLKNYWPVMAAVLPELEPLVGLESLEGLRNLAMPEPLAIHALCETPANPVLRWTVLLYGLEKAHEATHAALENGLHSGGVSQREAFCCQIMERLRFSGAMRDQICRLVRYMATELPTDTRGARRWLNRLGKEELGLLLACKAADCRARGQEGAVGLARLDKTVACMDKVLREGLCYRLPDLVVDGNDLLELGMSGRAVGRCLDALLEDVMEDRLPNERDALLAAARAKLEGAGV